ncbi:hypothetical protein DQ392_33660 [Streptomyces reniochalinae]|uniref:Uncharacterized protein n=1 Tax=Streptomyces reniochalinae TaxID=2250578 RepID=A0A367E5B0_9ACTN|nr:hypothetical protein DQ392_33660 [Streptomyces reniochalinae]
MVAVVVLGDVLVRNVPGPVAVLVGGSPEPQAAAAGLARLLQQVPGAGVLRTGLGAFGALGLGAGFSAFGVDSSMRQVLPPETQSRPGGGPGSPSVLCAPLMNFYLGSRWRPVSTVRPLSAHASAAGARRWTVFSTWRSRCMPAAGHNACVLTGWARQSHALDAAERGRWWQGICRSALERYPQWSQRVRHEQGFAVGPELPVWARMPVPERAPGRVRGAGRGVAQ